METETHPATTAESQITVTVTAPEQPQQPAVERTQALPSAPALSTIRALEQTPAVPPTEAAPQPQLPFAPTVSRKYCKMVLFKYFEIIYLRHQLIIIVTNVRDEHRICVYK